MGTDEKWKFSTRLQDPEGDSSSGFGNRDSVLTSDNYVYFITNSGTYEYEYTSDGTWQQNSKIPVCFKQVSENYAIVCVNSAIYIYERDQTGVWRQKQELTATYGKSDTYSYSSIYLEQPQMLPIWVQLNSSSAKSRKR